MGRNFIYTSSWHEGDVVEITSDSTIEKISSNCREFILSLARVCMSILMWILPLPTGRSLKSKKEAALR